MSNLERQKKNDINLYKEILVLILGLNLKNFIDIIIYILENLSNENSTKQKRETYKLRFNNILNYMEENNIEKTYMNILGGLLSLLLSKTSSRQGSIKEKKDFDFCNERTKNINIEKLPNTGKNSLRPTEEGKLMKGSEYKEYKKKNKININNYKTIDGKIVYNEETIGYVFHKDCNNNGGHQDNVFIEIKSFLNWIKKYNDNTKYFLLLINGNKKAKIEDLISDKKVLNLNKTLIMNNDEWIIYANENFV